MIVDSQSQHFQSQAVAILALATAVLGFGLLGAELRVGMELWSTAKLVAGGYAIAAYVMTLRSIRDILKSEGVDGRDVAQGPPRYMFLVVTYVTSIFVIGIFDGPTDEPPPV